MHAFHYDSTIFNILWGLKQQAVSREIDYMQDIKRDAMMKWLPALLVPLFELRTNYEGVCWNINSIDYVEDWLLAEVAMPANLRIRKLPYKHGGLISPFLSLPFLMHSLGEYTSSTYYMASMLLSLISGRKYKIRICMLSRHSSKDKKCCRDLLWKSLCPISWWHALYCLMCLLTE